jgi:transcriptional regulator with XRE-family HTH domain
MNKVIINNKVAQIGEVLRVVREKTGRHQGAIAADAGISTSMLSQIERGIVAPSIDTLFAVCRALDFDIAELFRRVTESPPVRIAHNQTRLRTEHEGVGYEQLITGTGAGYQSELFLLTVRPGHQAGLNTNGHEGIEMGYVLEGRGKLVVNSIAYAIGKSDSFCFHAHFPHRFVNDSTSKFVAVWAALPPHTDYLEVEKTDG